MPVGSFITVVDVHVASTYMMHHWSDIGIYVPSLIRGPIDEKFVWYSIFKMKLNMTNYIKL